MKRLSALLLSLTLALSLTACADDVSGIVFTNPPVESDSTTIETTPIAPAQSNLSNPSDKDSEKQNEDNKEETDPAETETDFEASNLPQEGEYYYDLEQVVLYLELYDTLPNNFITKNEARELGWQGGSVEKYLDGAAIGGDRFGNREGLLPQEKGRSYTECDLNTDGADSRGAERLVFSSDGLYFYTSDHYEHFTEYIVTDDWTVVEA